MKIQNINPITPHINFCAASGNARCRNVPYRPKPVQEAVTTAGAWFAFGIGLDLLSRKMRFAKSPTKNSIIMNGIIATCAGLYAGVKGVSGKKH